MKLEPSSADMLECVAVEIPQVIRKGLRPLLLSTFPFHWPFFFADLLPGHPNVNC